MITSINYELKKGDLFLSEFFKVGNYLAAISAYSYGIKISEKMASLYVNRSAAHYALENYCRCIDDCSKVHFALNYRLKMYKQNLAFVSSFFRRWN